AALRDPSPDVSEAAALVLAARVGKPRAGEPGEATEARAQLVKLVSRPEALALVGALAPASRPGPHGEARSPESAPDSALRSAPPPNYETRLAAALELGTRRDEAAVRELAQLLHDPAEPVRAAAVDGLAAAKRGDLLAPTAYAHVDPATRRRA